MSRKLLLFLLALLVIPFSALGSGDFDNESGCISNPMSNVSKPGDFAIFKGDGDYAGFTLYESARGLASIDGVECLEVDRYLSRNGSDSSQLVRDWCISQDMSGNVFLLKQSDQEFSKESARLIMPSVLNTGLRFAEFDGNYKEVVSCQEDVSLSKDSAVFKGCTMLHETIDSDLIKTYIIPHTGTVLIRDDKGGAFALKYYQRNGERGKF